ncbi:MAG: Rieske (2Fe-2S) protein [Alphaproteobacteria bacterium]
MRPPAGTPLFALGDLTEPGAKGLSFGTPGQMFEMILVRFEGHIMGFQNECPHALTPLEFMPDKFFNREKTHLLCSTHGAQFRPDDGLCVQGPCKAKALKPVPLRLEGDQIVMGEDGGAHRLPVISNSA